MKSYKKLADGLWRSRIAPAGLFLCAASCLMSGAEMRAEEVVSRHLDSIGKAEARSAVKTRIVQGTSRYKILVGGGGELQGTSARWFRKAAKLVS